MWYNRMILGESSYEVVLWFMVYSVMGWLVESIYMSVCNRRLTNRGFAKGPCCPIYGFGAVFVYFLLRPFADDPAVLFFMGSFVATGIEVLTAVIMKRLFGEVWWDYREKPFNYRGIICLESSVAWGFYTIFLFWFLQKFVSALVGTLPLTAGKVIGSVFLTAYAADFLLALGRARRAEEIKEYEREGESAGYGSLIAEEYMRDKAE